MGSMLSTAKNYDNNNSDGARGGSSLSQDGNILERETVMEGMDGLRFAKLMHALQRIVRLQREATSARIEARQKRREAAFKRQEVWVWDAKFMGETQRLSAEGKLEGLEEMQRLASQCQSARDGLGPLEDEVTEAEQCWEGQIYALRQAEEQLYNDFSREFAVASAYPPASSSDLSSRYGSSPGQNSANQDSIPPDMGGMIIPHRAAASVSSSSSFLVHPLLEGGPTVGIGSCRWETVLPGLEGIAAERENDPRSGCSDSGFEDINGSMDEFNGTGVAGPSQPLPKRDYSSVELYPHLLIDFTSKRDRINKWLEATVLESHLEATLLFSIVKTRLAAENKSVPSNWSQLVIAYWELDGAANLRFGQEQSKLTVNPQGNRTDQRGIVTVEQEKQEGHSQHYETSEICSILS